MPFLAPRILSNERAAWVLSAGMGALVLAPAGWAASLTLATLCALAYAIAHPSRAPTAHDASRRAAFAFAFLASLAGAVALAASLSYRGHTVVLTALGVYARDLPFHGFLAYVVGALLVGPLARVGQRLARRPHDYDGWQRLVTTGALVATFAMLPSLAGAHGDGDLATLVAITMGGTWLGCLWVVASHASAHRLVARVRSGRLTGYRVRGPATAAERRALAPLFSEYVDDEQPLDALVRVAEAGTGAYREAPVEEPVALVPSEGARATHTSPALVAVLVPAVQALMLLVAWSM